MSTGCGRSPTVSPGATVGDQVLGSLGPATRLQEPGLHDCSSVTDVAVMVATLLDGKITAMAGPLGHRTLGSYLSFQPSPPSATGDNIQLLDRRSLSASAQTVGCYLPLVSPSQPDLSPKPLVIGGDCRGGEMNGLWGVDEGQPQGWGLLGLCLRRRWQRPGLRPQ